MGADGQMRALREGTNGFTCMPDNPATPGPDLMCMDKAALEWAGAWKHGVAGVTARQNHMPMLRRVASTLPKFCFGS